MFNGQLADQSAGAHIVYDCAYCTLIVRRIYKIYEADLWIVRGWIIGVLLAGTPGIADSRALSVCHDCLCLMALFRAVMSLARYWAEEFVWTGHEGSWRSIAWEERYLPRLHPPCVVDRLCGYTTEIKV